MLHAFLGGQTCRYLAPERHCPMCGPGAAAGQCGYERKATALPGLGHISKSGRQSVAIRVVGTPRRGPFIRKSHRPHLDLT